MRENSKTRPYREHSERNWRHDKRRPRRTRIEVTEDLGRTRHKTLISMPPGSTIEHQNIPKKRSGNWQVVHNHVIRIMHSKTEDRYYLYDREGNYLGEMSQTDLYTMSVDTLSHIGGFNEAIHKQKRDPKTGKRIGKAWIIHTLKRKSKLK